MTDVSPFFRPFDLRSLHLANRIVMAPMTRSFSPGGVPGSDVASYYERRARHGVGLIITEGAVIDHPAAANDPRVPRFHGDDALGGWAKVCAAVHAAGGKIAPQLWHTGTMRRADHEPNRGTPPIGPSGLARAGKPVTEPMTERDIADVIAAFAKGAADAHHLGFDAIELHGAHGYLIDQFFWDSTNARTDRFGGDAVRRATFAADVVKACRRATSPDFPIILRFSQWKQQDFAARLAPTPKELEQFLAPLVDAGVDIFHCSTRRFWQPEFDGSPMNLAGWTKKLSGRAVITVGSIGLDQDFVDTFRGPGAGRDSAHIETLREMFVRDGVDLAAVGRALIADPGWVEKLRDGRLAESPAYSPSVLAELV
jgi:2,4-dienoyl-CoA reductase-like NADH-dependent reductase (Old Yellow Enzyme family)